jgi:glycosyltransferase involved in cell wall biosynthesis
MNAASKSIVYVWDADYPWDVRTEKVTLALTRAGHAVKIVARNRAWKQTTERLPEGTVQRMAPWKALGRRLDNALGFPAFFSPRWFNLIDRTCRNAKADLIIVRDLPLCLTAILCGKRLGVPVMLDMAENYPAMMRVLWETGLETLFDYFARNPSITAKVERSCVKNVDHIVVVVEESADRVAALGVPRSKLTVVSNTPPLARLDEPSRQPDPMRVTTDVVYMGNLEVVRGLPETLDAVAHLKNQGKRVLLRIIGRGRDEALLRAHAASLGLTSDDVKFLGYIASHAEALRIVAASDVGLIPHRKNDSWDTTIPNKLFDYMAAGLPVVSSNTKPCTRIVLETGCGELFQSGDAASMAQAIVLATSPEVSAQMAAAGRRAILDRYNWENDKAALAEAVARVKKM